MPVGTNSNMKIAIVDYQVSNLFSVKHACDAVGVSAEISSDREFISQADGLILPGVGAFGDAMVNLKRLDLIDVMLEAIKRGKAFMGVCLGMQLLMTTSEEFGHHQGLNILSGTVKKFPSKNPAGEILRVPQIGWNTIYSPKQTKAVWEESPLRSLAQNDYVYFVHSFYVTPDDPTLILSLTNYNGFEYASSLQQDNISAFQFHPEKSGQDGIKIYKDWAITIKR